MKYFTILFTHRKMTGLGLAILSLVAVMLFGFSAASAWRNPQPIQPLMTSLFSPTLIPTNTPEAVRVTETVPSQTPGATATRIPSPAPTLIPSSTPRMGVIWSKEAPAANLREEPSGHILAPLPNGVQVRLLDSRIEKNGLFWQKVVAYFPNSNPSGWVAEELILNADLLPGDHPAAIQAESGAYLRAEPGGRLVAFLSKGTLLESMETVDLGAVRWVHIRVPDGSEGWVIEDLIGPWEWKLR
jgi:hypothetical protein